MWLVYRLEAKLQHIYNSCFENTNQIILPEDGARVVPVISFGKLVFNLTKSSILLVVVIHISVRLLSLCWFSLPVNDLLNHVLRWWDPVTNQQRRRSTHISQYLVPAGRIEVLHKPKPPVPSRPAISAANINQKRANQLRISEWDENAYLWEAFELDMSDLHRLCQHLREQILSLFNARVAEVESTALSPSGTQIAEPARTKLVVARDEYRRASRKRLNLKYMHVFWDRYNDLCTQGQRLYQEHLKGSRQYGQSKLELERFKLATNLLYDDVRQYENTSNGIKNPKGRPTKPPKPKNIKIGNAQLRESRSSPEGLSENPSNTPRRRPSHLDLSKYAMSNATLFPLAHGISQIRL